MSDQTKLHAEICTIQALAAAYLHAAFESGAFANTSVPELALTIYRCAISEHEREGPLPDELGNIEGERIDVPV